MADPTKLQIKGLKELLGKMASFKAAQFLRGILMAAGEMIRHRVAVYAPASMANLPNAKGRFYQRGYGPRWLRKDGTLGGRRSSEFLGRCWYVRMAGVHVAIGNKATYAPYVQGRDQQAGFHKARGWTTLEDAADQALPEIQKRLQAEVDARLSGRKFLQP